ncbi:NADP oxidoreductase [Microbacterium laevaniformans]|uniref:NADP oxidoreductase n=1 Tax=Microbacterium laevaniformans TaxID=36807 RepID=A0A4S2CVH0_9MICO|nr:NAD(P)-binding domain-containing protein [Microbacterium laevaniformans]TGY32929.1 NADP oxidoreductase [Microbacterium laevaniformans]
MKISVLGTGMVGRALAARLHELGHDVAIGTRDVAATLTRITQDPERTREWREATADIPLLSFRDAGLHAEVILNATAGAHSLAAFDAIGDDALAGKVVLDLAIPLDLSRGLPPELTIVGDDSLGERIQRAHPQTRVVKSLHTMYYEVMIDPGRLSGSHVVFVGGEDASAKAVVTELLQDLGWPADSVIDLGGIISARATEMYSRLFFALYAQLETFDFNIQVVRAAVQDS